MKYSWIIVILLLASCVSETTIEAPDVSNIEVKFDNYRLDQELFESKNIEATLVEFEKSKPAFFNLYFKQVLPLYTKDRDSLNLRIGAFAQDSTMKALYDTVQVVYPGDKLLDEELTLAFKRLKYYIPNVSIPDVYSFISEFGYQLFMTENAQGRNVVGVGLDLLLDDYPYRSVGADNPAFSDYLTRTYRKDHVVNKIVQLIISDYAYGAQLNTFLDQIIANGKQLYITKHILAEEKDAIIFEYTQEQMDWVKSNEKEIWSFFIGEDMFYKTDTKLFNKYINPSPDAPGMPEAAPGRIANYIGYKIIAAYMKKNPNMSYQALLQTQDAQKILEESRYKPKR